MKVLIIEDEVMAAERMEDMINELAPDFQIVNTLDTVVSARKWLMANENPDLIFLDIQLADGLSFEIFEGLRVTSPIIFTTAYDDYAIRAFKLNSIDYLLKPIDKDGLQQALTKFRSNHSMSQNKSLDTQEIFNLLSNRGKQYKERFVIKVGEHIKTVLAADVRIFFSREKATFLQTVDHKKFIVDYPLDQLEQMINPQQYFRINRKFIVHISGIEDIISYSNSRLQIILTTDPGEQLIVARDRVNEFKNWLDR